MNRKPIESSDEEALQELLQLERVLSYLENAKAFSYLEKTEIGEQVREARKETEEAPAAIKKDGDIYRQIRGNKKVKPRKTKKEILEAAKKRRAYEKLYYHNQWRPQRNKRMLEDVERDGWWEYLRRKWTHDTHQKEGWEIGKEEWDLAVGESLKGYIPVICRYNTKKPWTLSNVYVIDSETRRVLFDGAEHTMRAHGYIL